MHSFDILPIGQAIVYYSETFVMRLKTLLINILNKIDKRINILICQLGSDHEKERRRVNAVVIILCKTASCIWR